MDEPLPGSLSFLDYLKRYYLRGPLYTLIFAGLFVAFELLHVHVDVLMRRLQVDELSKAYESLAVRLLTVLAAFVVFYYLFFVGLSLWVRKKLYHSAVIFSVFLALQVLNPWTRIELFVSIESAVTVPILIGFCVSFTFLLLTVADIILARLNRRTLLDRLSD